ncbi:MAG: hypothetical protein EOO77_28640 [Oxalobacteraceae bacterium]|nr:MAG: hypothetical protein EOO77_28640 [Oxalobacteraceae bacterium]
MARNVPRDHHWWPVALQDYWADKNGEVSWIEPDEKVGKKKHRNRKIGYKIHGHTLSRGGGWPSTNFESEFDIDARVHDIVTYLVKPKPLGQSLREVVALLKCAFNKERKLLDLSKVYHIEERIGRDLLLLIYSLLIRSPSSRFKYESFPERFGLPVIEDVGKANMLQNYRMAKKLCENGVLTNRFFVLLHSDFKHFICGDGYLDWLSGELQAGRVGGRALIPLTPNLCVYICTPIAMRSDRNCASLRAPAWMVDRVNEIVQIYSRDKLFFLGRKPQLTDEFRMRQFLQHSSYSVDLFQMFDELAAPRSPWAGFQSSSAPF